MIFTQIFLRTSLFFVILLFYVSGTSANDDYRVGVNDILTITVTRPERLSSDVIIASDGSITFTYIGNVPVNGKKLSEIQKEIEDRLADGYMRFPVVTVTLKENRSKQIYILGEVARPGAYVLETATTVLQALSLAGGLTSKGALRWIKILRSDPKTGKYISIPIDLTSVMSNQDSAKDIVLQPQDVVIASEGTF